MINPFYMKSRITSALNFFVVGGTMHRHAPSYVKRPADDELLKQVLAGQFCYVLTSRQMGKSSLMVRTVQRLKAKQIKSVIIDLSAIGTVTVDQWYLALLARIARKLSLSVSPEVWWQEQASLSIVQRFTEYLLHVALAESSGQLVILIDEINSTMRFDFTDDFFAAIRAMYNARAHNSTFERLTFVLLGVASPEELIKDRTRSPFNIGYRIALPEFSRHEANVLQSGLELLHPNYGQTIFDRIYHWTSGHPYLTQKLCLAAASAEHEEWTAAQVDELVQQLFFWTEEGRDTNLQSVQDRILSHQDAQKQLDIYQQIYNGMNVPDDPRSPLQNNLKLSCLVKEKDGYLRVRNEIYRHVFNQDWLREKSIFIRTKRKAQTSRLTPIVDLISSNGQQGTNDLATIMGQNGTESVTHGANGVVRDRLNNTAPTTSRGQPCPNPTGLRNLSGFPTTPITS